MNVGSVKSSVNFRNVIYFKTESDFDGASMTLNCSLLPPFPGLLAVV